MIQFTEDEVEMRVLFLIKFRSYSYPILLDEVIRFLIVISALSCVRIKIIQIDKIYRDYNLDSYRYRFVLPFPTVHISNFAPCSRNDPNIRIVERFTFSKSLSRDVELGRDKSSCILSSDDLIWRSYVTRRKKKGT